jgi:hypothetical protein
LTSALIDNDQRLLTAGISNPLHVQFGGRLPQARLDLFENAFGANPSPLLDSFACGEDSQLDALLTLLPNLLLEVGVEEHTRLNFNLLAGHTLARQLPIKEHVKRTICARLES